MSGVTGVRPGRRGSSPTAAHRGRCGQRLAGGLLLLLLLLTAAPVRADTVALCQDSPPLTAAQQDRLLRVSARIQQTLQDSGAPLALVARAGTSLGRLGHRDSHAGFAWRAPEGPAPWQVRQLYFDCGSGRPRLFDQGLAGFLVGAQQPDRGFFTVWLLPAAAQAPLQAAVLDDRRALQLLHPHYSANSHAWSLQYQNCNQWVVEMLAVAWGRLPLQDVPPLQARQSAQDWLRQAGYQPSVVVLPSVAWRLAGLFIPYVRHDDHPEEDLLALRYRVSMPASIGAWVMQQAPDTRRVAFCHTDTRLVVRHGGPPLDDDCTPQPGDEVLPLA